MNEPDATVVDFRACFSAPVFSCFRLEDGPQVSPSASLFEDAEPVGQPMFVDRTICRVTRLGRPRQESL